VAEIINIFFLLKQLSSYFVTRHIPDTEDAILKGMSLSNRNHAAG